MPHDGRGRKFFALLPGEPRGVSPRARPLEIPHRSRVCDRHGRMLLHAV